MSAFDLSLPDSIPDDRYRRRSGLALGALLGLCYALAQYGGNALALAGLPLWQPPFGLFGNTLIFAVGGALLGLLVAWPRSGLTGVFMVAAAGAAGIVVVSLATAEELSAGVPIRMIAALTLALPFWGLLTPIFALVRWVIGREEEARRDGQPWRRRARGQVALLLLVGLVGWAAMLPPRGRETLRAADALLSEVARAGALPPELAPVSGLAEHIGSPYTLSWEARDIERFRIPRPSRNFDQHSAVIARFEGGWHLVCIYIVVDDWPLCDGFDVLPE